MSVFKYYKIEDSRDWCRSPDIFKVCFKNKENAISEAKKYVENNITSLLSLKPENTRPKEGSAKISVEGNIIKLTAIKEVRITECKTVKKKVIVDGEEYYKNEMIKEVVRDWHTPLKQCWHWLGPTQEEEKLEYALYIVEEELIFYDQ